MTADLHLYDPALCCSSGVCGPSVDPVLVRVQADIEWLKSKGIRVERHNLAQQAADFTANPEVLALLQDRSPEALPFVFVNGKVAAIGFYPTRDQFAALFGLAPDAETSGNCEGACSCS
jgi:hypothetical protein